MSQCGIEAHRLQRDQLQLSDQRLWGGQTAGAGHLEDSFVAGGGRGGGKAGGGGAQASPVAQPHAFGLGCLKTQAVEVGNSLFGWVNFWGTHCYNVVGSCF